jgi:hypothetical protein
MLHKLTMFRSIIFQEDTGAETRRPLVTGDTALETAIAAVVLIAAAIALLLHGPFH